MKLTANLNWSNEMSFECDNRGMKSTIDAMADFGGKNKGPTPKELVLNAMMGCTAMDVVSMLKKMRQGLEHFSMTIEAEKNLEHPIHFKTATIFFHLKGSLDPEKAIKAVTSSLTKYCGVNYMMSKTCEIGFEVFVNDLPVYQGKAEFIDPAT